tara:strand:+ start:47 stop:490 length:444 start_codon:yes stop_codon:yes gene_type:complete
MSGYFIVFIIIVFLSLGTALVVHLCNRSNKVENYSQKDPMLMELQSLLIKLHPKATTIDMTEAGKSYTVNKKHMHLCLRNEKKEYFNKNHLIYVAIHELAHVVCPSIGHTQEFWDYFDKLLNKAIAMGIYNPSIPIVADYQDRCQMG